jgi:Ca2+-binding RTX toxin-like protein
LADLTPQEQLMLELINRARMDPEGEARRFGIKLNEGVSNVDKISSSSKQVLAGNDLLQEAATSHSEWMIRNDAFSHEEKKGTPGFTGVDESDRVKAAGYDFTLVGENISFRASTASLDATKEIIKQHADLFIDANVGGRGHRLNILNEDFQEAGIGQELGDYTQNKDTFNATMVTQNFGRSANKVFVTGVVYDDTVKKDDFFSVGEQRSGIAVSSAGANDSTGAGGGYELQFAANAGARSVTFAGGISVDLTLGATNVKIDLVNRDEIWTNSSIEATSTAVAELHALGIDDIDLAGSSAADAIYGNKGRNVLSGQGGNDTLDGDRGIDELHGGSGADTFVFAKGDTGKSVGKADVITDFSVAESDTIDLSAWDANTKKDGNQVFIFIDDQDFHNKAGELRAFVDGNGDTLVLGDTNGDGKADLAILLEGSIALTQASFDL